MVQSISSSSSLLSAISPGSVNVTSTPLSPTPQSAYVDKVENAVQAAPTGIVDRIMEFGKKFLENPKFIGAGFNILPGVALGFRVEGSLHSKTSPLVTQNPFRVASTTCLQKENPRHTIVWTQTGGVLELGLGINGTLPLGQFVGVQGGFIPSTLLRYRTVKPHVLGFFQTQNSLLANNETSFPFSSERAKKLVAGSEYELSGQGRLRGLLGLVANAGTPVNSWLNAGVGASAFVNVAEAKELSINVLSLDGENKVRVSINRINEDIAQAGLMAYAGIIGQIGPQFPSIGQGLLQGGPTLLATPIADMLNGYFTCFSAQASMSERCRDTNIATFDIDLSKPKASEAFDALMRLSCVEAEELSAIKESGVRLLKRSEREQESRDEVSANLLGDKLYLYQALTTEKNGRFTTPDGDTTLFRQAHYKEHESGWFEPTRDVLWESVSTKPLNEKDAKTFYRFKFQKDGQLPEIEFDDYFGVAQALSLNGNEEKPHPHPAGKNDDVCKRLLCGASSVKQATDLYFTPQGIRNMKSATSEHAREAYLRSIAQIRDVYDLSFLKTDSTKESKLISLLEKYAEELRAGWFLNFGHAKRLSDLESEYKSLCGREIYTDSVTYSNASIFAMRLSGLKSATSPKDLEAFFVDLGKSKGFRYKCVIGALATLAGEKETLVHQHEMSGNGVVFKVKDGGQIEGPSEIVTALLSKHL